MTLARAACYYGHVCGRFASHRQTADIRPLFATMNAPSSLSPTGNVAPTQLAMVIRHYLDTGERSVDILHLRMVSHITRI